MTAARNDDLGGSVTVSWSVSCTIVKLTTKRSLKQIASYYASVWLRVLARGDLTNFGNEYGFGRKRSWFVPRHAEVSIASHRHDKSCGTMSVMLVTIAGQAAQFPISLAEP